MLFIMSTQKTHDRRSKHQKESEHSKCQQSWVLWGWGGGGGGALRLLAGILGGRAT